MAFRSAKYAAMAALLDTSRPAANRAHAAASRTRGRPPPGPPKVAQSCLTQAVVEEAARLLRCGRPSVFIRFLEPAEVRRAQAWRRGVHAEGLVPAAHARRPSAGRLARLLAGARQGSRPARESRGGRPLSGAAGRARTVTRWSPQSPPCPPQPPGCHGSSPLLVRRAGCCSAACCAVSQLAQAGRGGLSPHGCCCGSRSFMPGQARPCAREQRSCQARRVICGAVQAQRCPCSCAGWSWGPGRGA